MHRVDLEGKKILFFAPAFFGYEKHIEKRLTERGADVDYFNERFSDKTLFKIIMRLNKHLLSACINRYYKRIYKTIKGNHYDIFLVINIETMPVWFVKKITTLQSCPVKILYIWDSMAWKHNLQIYFNHFDRVYSFDRKDVLKYKDKILLRPLFYLPQYADIKPQQKYDYDLCFIGSAHTDRYKIACALKQIARQNNFTTFIYLYLQKPYVYYLSKLTNRNFAHSRKSDFAYTPLTERQITDIMQKSRIIVDTQGPNQSGLTMRTIETLAARRKMITTNDDIVNYDFYCPDNICVCDFYKTFPSKAFLDSPFAENRSEQYYYKYSLDGFLDDILS
ncbi:MAG: DUF3880 domain-containing protein [Bacteroidales bacterium]|jgi:hypothetical protein|nr:DUF3880 domain-containing protein [Bacteroidales bacterium]